MALENDTLLNFTQQAPPTMIPSALPHFHEDRCMNLLTNSVLWGFEFSVPTKKLQQKGGKSCRAYRDCIAWPWLCPCEVLRFLEVKGLVPPRKPSGSHLSSKQFDAATQRWPWYVLLQKLWMESRMVEQMKAKFHSMWVKREALFTVIPPIGGFLE